MAKRTSRKAAARGGRQAHATMQGHVDDRSEQARLGAESMDAGVESGAVFTGAAQAVAQEWVNYAQGAAFRNMRTMSSMARCRTIKDLMEAQASRVAEEFDEFARSTRRVSERLLGAAERAAGDGARPSAMRPSAE